MKITQMVAEADMMVARVSSPQRRRRR